MNEAGPIDCDLYPTVPGLRALLPYLDDHWRETAVRRGFDEARADILSQRQPADRAR